MVADRKWAWLFVLFLMACSSSGGDMTKKSWHQSDGNEYALHDTEQFIATVFVFLAPACPLSENYCLTVNKLSQQFQGNIQFRAVVTGTYYSKDEIEKFIRQFGLDIPVILDPNKDMATYFQASITPEVFVVDATSQVLYSGAIDNWFADLGQQREVITEFYLRDVLQALQDGMELPFKQTKAVGCYIE
jgi:thiol-disulfide isomerase/thioredoxin